MGRPRKKPLPRGIRERVYRSGRRTYWIDFRLASGERVQERGGDTIEEAVLLLRQRREAVDRGTFRPGVGSGQQTIETFALHWLELRRAEGVRSAKREEQILRLHIVPAIGAIRLCELRPRDVAAWIRDMEAAATLSPKSIRNAHGVLSALLARARFDELIADNPAKALPRGVLPKNARRRQVSAWGRAELETLISDERIPEDRRVAYTIAAFTGTRLGEIAGLRWRDLDTAARPLWRWSLRTQYDGRPLKTEHPRDVPIHPELRRVLAAWKLDGWVRFMCRPGPTPDDFVVPRHPSLHARRPQHLRTPFHSEASLGAKAVHRHAAKVGIDATERDFHSFRRAMITIARTDGARVDVLERVTHNAAGAVIDGYTYFGWEALCEAVSCIRLSVRKYAEVRSLPRAIGDASGDAPRSEMEKANVSAGFPMEAAGVEPSGSERELRNSTELRDSGRHRAPLAHPENPADSERVPLPVTRVTAAHLATLRRMLSRTTVVAERKALAAAIGVLGTPPESSE